MNLQYGYWVFKEAFPLHLCKDIVAYGLKHAADTAMTGSQPRDLKKNPFSKQELKKLHKHRQSHIAWLHDEWIYKEIRPYIHKANKEAGWNFEWDLSESIQFTHYQLNYHYGWHRDAADRPYSGLDKSRDGKIRKLSVTISLSAPEDYRGGNLEFNFFNNIKSKAQVCEEIKPQGSIVVFPSFVYHRVTPVTKGTRYSLVLWQLGKPFK
jgi:PKHD-type hydroxylase